MYQGSNTQDGIYSKKKHQNRSQEDSTAANCKGPKHAEASKQTTIYSIAIAAIETKAIPAVTPAGQKTSSNCRPPKQGGRHQDQEED
jgi:hypothetical protein